MKEGIEKLRRLSAVSCKDLEVIRAIMMERRQVRASRLGILEFYQIDRLNMSLFSDI